MEKDGKGQNFPELVSVMQRLLAPDGCPWDREQSFKSLRAYVIEEAYEVVEAIEHENFEALCEELGDLLLQVVFQAELARAAGYFGPDDVIQGICDKLLRRHPHVFGDAEAKDEKEALEHWEALKAQEKKNRGRLDGVPQNLPALLRAYRVGEKASSVGYDWKDTGGIRAKITEELAELDQAIEDDDSNAIEHELGDVLFALCSLGRHRKIDPEVALRGTLDRFAKRFAWVEQEAKRSGKAIERLSDSQRDALWQSAKMASDEAGS
ncbi:MAG: nucleoside triphosphate pyrophosphohydrolase [Myxococcales bacterium]|nr:MAG: nucleoside triphosphate pyrophosphohydrolase [Myxococcales bacterium]